jgi:hypothetical protein
MNVVLEDRGLIDCWEVPGKSSAADSTVQVIVAYPLVKTLSKDVFPQAPSPLSHSVSSQVQDYATRPLASGRNIGSYRRTSFRCVVRDPPQSGTFMAAPVLRNRNILPPEVDCFLKGIVRGLMWLNSAGDERRRSWGSWQARGAGLSFLGGGREIKRRDSMNLASFKPADAN